MSEFVVLFLTMVPIGGTMVLQTYFFPASPSSLSPHCRCKYDLCGQCGGGGTMGPALIMCSCY